MSYVDCRSGGGHLTVAKSVDPEAASAASGIFGHGIFEWGDLPISVIEILLGPLLAVLVAVGVALFAWLRQLHVMRRRATFDYITNHLLPPTWLEQHNKAIGALKTQLATKEQCSSLAKRWSDSELEPSDFKLLDAVLPHLNHLEFAAIGLRWRTQALNRRIYASAWGIPFIQTWQRAETLLHAMHATERGEDFLRSFHTVAQSWSFRRIARWDDKYSVPEAKPTPDPELRDCRPAEELV